MCEKQKRILCYSFLENLNVQNDKTEPHAAQSYLSMKENAYRAFPKKSTADSLLNSFK